MPSLFVDPITRLTQDELLDVVRRRQGAMERHGEWVFIRLADCLYRLPEGYACFFSPPVGRSLDSGCRLVDVTMNPVLRLYWDCHAHKLLSLDRGTFYLIRCGIYHKIGITTDFAARYRRYVSECPYENEVVFQVPVDGFQQIESRLKKFFEPKLHRGEWFRLTTGDVRLLRWIFLEDLACVAGESGEVPAVLASYGH